MKERQIEISRFTYFYQNLSIGNLEGGGVEVALSTQCSDIQKLSVQTHKPISDILPLSQNFINVWDSEYKQEAIWGAEVAEGTFIFAYLFNVLNNNVVIFEKRVIRPLSQILEASNEIKIDCKKIYASVIKQKLPSWQGGYNVDGDFFYFVNIPLENFYSHDKNTKDVDLSIIRDVKYLLTFDGKCIFAHLGFEDKSFPNEINYAYGLSQILVDEQQPLLVISPVQDKNKLIIFDDKLFVRCYLQSEEDSKPSVSIKLVIKTVLCQRAFLEYAASALVNISDDKIKSMTSFAKIQIHFGRFTDVFWRLDISDSFYLNKAYRIIGKLWLLNEKYELVRQHLTRNSDLEQQYRQSKINLFLGVIGFLTLISVLKDAYDLWLKFMGESYTWVPFVIILCSVIAFIWFLYRKK